MRTAWGDLSVSDAHVHFFSHRFFRTLAEQRGDPSGERAVEKIGRELDWEMPPAEPDRLAERWARELDRNGVRRSVLIASVPGEEDSVAVAVACFPQRFWGYFMLNPCAPDALARAQRALGRGLCGICLYPAMHGFSVQDERVLAVLGAAARQRGAVVFVHCGVLTVGVRKKLGLPSPFDMRFSNPVELHAVALRFPSLPFVIPHFGAGYFREALMVAELCPNVYLDTSSTNSWVRYHEPPPNLTAVFRRALEVAGPRRLLFGTDSSYFPRGWHSAIFAQQAQVLADLGVSAEDARAIFGGNLERLLER